MAEFDMIGHLMNVESQVADMLLGVQSEAGERVVKAREEGEARYQKRCDEARASSKERLAAEEEAVTKMQGEALESYRASIGSSEKDAGAFNGLLDKILFA